MARTPCTIEPVRKVHRAVPRRETHSWRKISIICVMIPEIRTCITSDGVRIAFWAAGHGQPLFLVNAPLPNHLEKEWEVAELCRWYESLTEHFMVIRYNPRGFGLSQRDVGDVSLTAQHLDLDAVIGALGLERVAVLAESLSAPIILDYSVCNPAKITHLILWNGVSSARDFFSTPMHDALLSVASKDWISYCMAEASANRAWTRPQEVRQIANMCAESTSSNVFLRFVDTLLAFDATPLLPNVRSRTLILEGKDAPGATVARNRLLAARIPHSKLEIVDDEVPAFRVFESEDMVSRTVKFIREPRLDNENDAIDPAIALDFGNLTQRELQLLNLLMEGCSNHDLVEKMNISLHTVERHLANIYGKLGVHSRLEAIFHVRKLRNQGSQ